MISVLSIAKALKLGSPEFSPMYYWNTVQILKFLNTREDLIMPGEICNYKTTKQISCHLHRFVAFMQRCTSRSNGII
jgi:hypothetical protein